MVYILPYEADFTCPKGHSFIARVSPLSKKPEAARCPHCLEEWIAAHVANGTQVSPARPTPGETLEF